MYFKAKCVFLSDHQEKITPPGICVSMRSETSMGKFENFEKEHQNGCDRWEWNNVFDVFPYNYLHQIHNLDCHMYIMYQLSKRQHIWLSDIFLINVNLNIVLTYIVSAQQESTASPCSAVSISIEYG